MSHATQSRWIALAAMLMLGATMLASGCEEPKGLRITGYEPKTGPYTGGDAVVFKGSGFTVDGIMAAEVWFGGKKGSNVRFRGDNELIVDAPAGPVGESVDIIIKFEDGRTKPFENGYKYVDPSAGFGVGELTDDK